MRALGLSLLAAIMLALPVATKAQGYVPETRFALSENTDLPGGDIQSIFDTTLEGCQSACLADHRCTAFTFNSRSNSCFTKGVLNAPLPYQGAISGQVLAAPAGATARAEIRAAELSFLQPADLDAAFAQATGLAVDHLTNGASAEVLLDAATTAYGEGDALAASRFQGAALNLTDAADQWVEYARLLLSIPSDDLSERQAFAYRGLSAAINGYLRAEAPGLRASALQTMATALEGQERGRDMIPALRLAQSLQPREDLAAMLADAVGKYGFRIAEHQVQNESARPQVCAIFSEALVATGTDYSSFVRLPETGLSVEAKDNQICVDGVSHGKSYTITFREGLPAASGETMAQDVTLDLYVRDRTAAARFPGRAYILPRAAGAGIPVETVNTGKLDLVLQRISDRNLIRVIQNDYFGRPLDYWSAEDFSSQMAEEVWRGSGEVAMEVNRDVTTLLPLDEVLDGLGAGVYALQASVPGLDPYDHPPATQWFVISDLGLTTVTGIDGLHVFVRRLGDASAQEGVDVTLLSRANAIIGTAKTDQNGYALFPPALVAGQGGSAPALVSVAAGEDFSFLSLTEPEFDLSDRGVEGREPAPPIDVFLTTDRGAYRAGETVNATILSRDSRMAAIDGLPLTARLLRPDGVEYSRILADTAGAGGHVAALPIAGSAPRGTWRIEVFATEEQVLASQAFLVEDFLPERIDFTLSLPEAPLSFGAVHELGLEARYLFGAPGAGLQIEGDLRIVAVDQLEGFPGYVFGAHDEVFQTYWDSLQTGDPTDAEGKAAIPVALPDLGDAGARPLAARFAIRLKEGSGRPVERQITRTVLPETPIIGVRPLFKNGVAPEKADAVFDLVVIGSDAAPAAARLRWTMNRLETNYQWYSLYGQWNWEVSTTRTRIADGDVTLNGTAEGARIAAPVEWGNYEIVVETIDGAYSVTSMAFYAGGYAPADASSTPDTLELSLDKPAYRPGETASLRIVPRAAGVALVSVLSNRLIDMKAVPVSEGENIIDLPVTDDWGAGAYVTVSVIRPMDLAAGHNPARALGLSYAAVDPGQRRLSARFETAAEAEPRGPLPVAMKVEGVAAGETAWATIAAVDAGILNLTAFASPDPASHYFGQRKLGVAIRDVYGRLIDGKNGAPGAVRSGGDAANGLKMQAPPPTEELVAYFSGPIKIGADGYARTEFALPSFNGTVRLMAVVWSKSAVGQAEAEVLVRDPVVVTASLPRFLAPGDESRLLLEIVHAAGPSGRMGLDVTAEGIALGDVPSGVDVADKGTALVSVPLSAGDAEGSASVRVALTTPDGRQLVKIVTLPIQSNEPEVARKSRFSLASGEAFTFDSNVFAGLAPGSGRATLAVGALARFDAPGLLAALDAYPYGCTEQLASQAMPLLYFEEVASRMGAVGADDLRQRVNETIAEILLNQSSSGAFGLWEPSSGDLWLDAYVTDLLSRARAQGYQVPETAFRIAMENLRNQVNYAPDFDTGGGPYAYALMVLAREGAAAIGDLRYYADVKADGFDTPIAAAQLGAALAFYGDQTRADAMFARAARLVDLASDAPEAQVWRADYGTHLRDAAAVLALASEAGSTVAEAPDLQDRVATGIAGRNLSTQEASWALLAAHASLDRPGNEGLTVDGVPAQGAVMQVLDADTAGGAETVIRNDGANDTTVTLTTFGVPAEPEAAGGNGYTISRSWFTPEGTPVDPASIKQGARLVAVIEVVPYAGGEARLMINDPLPAGFEIDNPNLVTGGDTAALAWLSALGDTQSVEFRQDRFMAAVDWTSRDSFRLAYVVRAVSPGVFHLPAASVEDMYRPDYRAHSDSGRITIAE